MARLASISIIIGAAACFSSFPVIAEDAPKPGVSAADPVPHNYTNRLIDSNDPYLLLHAHNPVDWYPWGVEAFAKAKKENKPVFISIGYSTCYWCHVAERTIYSNPEIAKLMNQWFVNVKVDSEQRPDLDRIYMLARQIITGQGGWPNNLFLTPDLKPFYAGSYFPPQDDPRAGPGFPTVLAALNQAWTSDRAQLLGVADNVMATMRRVQSTRANVSASIDPGAWMAKARDAMVLQFDPEYGGFAERRSGTKFPNPPRLALLLTDYQINHTTAALSEVLATLDAVAFGGIHDQLAGGFHRYSTEPTWSVPHFEKMLYDNAQLLGLYADAYRITRKSVYRQVAAETAHYLARDMMSPEGGFYTARDAQLNGVEGESYLWTRGEIAALLGEKETARFLSVYALTPLPKSDVPDIVHPREVNGESPAILRLRVPMDRTLRDAGFQDVTQLLADFAPDRAKLMAAREKREQPTRDEKIVVSLNGLAIAALVESGQILGEPEFVNWAKMAAERIWALAYDEKAGALKHEIFRGRAQTDGFLQDYGALGSAFMTLADITGDKTWQIRAAQLANHMLNRFGRTDGSFSTTPNEKDMLIPFPDEGDTEVPSGTSMAIDLLLRLNQSSGEARFPAAANVAVSRLSGQFRDRPEAWPVAISALNHHPLPSTGQTVAAANSPAAPDVPGGFSVPVSADHLRVTASAMSAPEGDAIVVTIKVDDKFHINANPASFDYLIPTSLEFKEIRPSTVEYPKPVRFTAKFAPEGLDVYEGSIAIVAKFPGGTLKKTKAIQGTLAAQACTNQVCLPPSNLSVSIGDTAQ